MNSDDMATVDEEKRKQRAGKLAQKMGWDLAGECLLQHH